MKQHQDYTPVGTIEYVTDHSAQRIHVAACDGCAAIIPDTEPQREKHDKHHQKIDTARELADNAAPYSGPY